MPPSRCLSPGWFSRPVTRNPPLPILGGRRRRRARAPRCCRGYPVGRGWRPPRRWIEPMRTTWRRWNYAEWPMASITPIVSWRPGCLWRLDFPLQGFHLGFYLAVRGWLCVLTPASPVPPAQHRLAVGVRVPSGGRASRGAWSVGHGDPPRWCYGDAGAARRDDGRAHMRRKRDGGANSRQVLA
jgi:hypothetical protein